MLSTEQSFHVLIIKHKLFINMSKFIDWNAMKLCGTFYTNEIIHIFKSLKLIENWRRNSCFKWSEETTQARFNTVELIHLILWLYISIEAGVWIQKKVLKKYKKLLPVVSKRKAGKKLWSTWLWIWLLQVIILFPNTTDAELHEQ